jgi:hypothetical protein
MPPPATGRSRQHVSRNNPELARFDMEKLDALLRAAVAERDDVACKDKLLGAAFLVTNSNGELQGFFIHPNQHDSGFLTALITI